MFNNVRFGQPLAIEYRPEPSAPDAQWGTQMADSARILARLAAARPSNYLTPSELMDMATNRHGDYSAPVQQAARNFFDNRRAVYAAHEQNRRRAFHNRGHHGSARRFEDSDLLGMGDLFSSGSCQSGADGGQQSSNYGGGGGRHPSRGHHPSFSIDAAYQEALEVISDYLGQRSARRGPRHASMTLDGLMAMDRGGHPAAGHLMDHWSRIATLFDQTIEGEMWMAMEDVEQELARKRARRDDPSDDAPETRRRQPRHDQKVQDEAVRAAGPIVSEPDDDEVEDQEDEDEEFGEKDIEEQEAREQEAEEKLSRKEAAEAESRRKENLNRRRLLEEDRRRRRLNSHGDSGGGAAAAAATARSRQNDDIQAGNRARDDLLREQRRQEDLAKAEIDRKNLLDDDIRRRDLEEDRLAAEDLERKRLDERERDR